MQFFDPAHFSDWLGRLRDLAASPAILEPLLLQLACIIAAFLLAWAIRAATRSWTDRLVERVTMRYRALRLPAGLRGLAIFCYGWLILVFAEQAVAQLGGDYRLIGIAASLTGLWIVIRASALLLRDPLLARAGGHGLDRRRVGHHGDFAGDRGGARQFGDHDRHLTVLRAATPAEIRAISPAPRSAGPRSGQDCVR